MKECQQQIRGRGQGTEYTLMVTYGPNEDPKNEVKDNIWEETTITSRYGQTEYNHYGRFKWKIWNCEWRL